MKRPNYNVDENFGKSKDLSKSLLSLSGPTQCHRTALTHTFPAWVQWEKAHSRSSPASSRTHSALVSCVMCVPTNHRGRGVLGHWLQSWLLVLEAHHLSYRDGAGGGWLSRDWERKNGSSAEWSPIPTQKSGNLLL